MPIGGKLVLKGGLQVTASGVTKKHKKKKKPREEREAGGEDAATAAEDQAAKPAAAAPQGISAMSNKTYEDEFALEMDHARRGKAKNTPWGSGYRPVPEGGILHGYDRKVKGKTAEERLDVRAAMKADKFCK